MAGVCADAADWGQVEVREILCACPLLHSCLPLVLHPCSLLQHLVSLPNASLAPHTFYCPVCCRYVPRPVEGDVVFTDYYGPVGGGYTQNSFYGRR